MINYYGLYYKKNDTDELLQMQKADLYFNEALIKQDHDDYSWNTTLAKVVKLPSAFWIVVSSIKHIRFDFLPNYTGYVVSKSFFDLCLKYTPNIQYIPVYIVEKKTQKRTLKEYFFIRFTAIYDYVDLEQSIYKTKFDRITKREEIISYSKLVLKEVPSKNHIFKIQEKFSNWVEPVFVSEMFKHALDTLDLKTVDIVPIENIALFHTQYYN